MSEFVNTIDILGDSGLEDAIVTKSLSGELNDDVITRLCYMIVANLPDLKKVNVPNLEFFNAHSLCRNTALEVIVASSVTRIYANAFQSDTSLKALVMGGSVLCSLDNVNAFTGTLIKSGTGYIYVPRALLADYQAATNWSTFADQFRALEDYTVDGTTTGELDETKI